MGAAMTQAEPTMGEVMRRLDEVARQMSELFREIKEDRAAAAATFVRQDVYIAQRHADHAVVADLASEAKAAKETLGREIRDVRRDMESSEAKRAANVRWAIG